MPRSYFVRNGRLQRDRGMDRGQMIVWTDEEWRRRFSEMMNRMMERAIIGLMIVYAACMVMLITMALLSGPGPGAQIFTIVIFFITLTFGIGIPMIMFQTKRGFAKAPAVGLYEGGLQLTPFYFIPYHEMKRTGRKMIGWPTKVEAVVMYPRYDKKDLLDQIRRPWTVLMTLLGIEGAHELERIVAGDVRSREPPKLVIYE